MPRADRTAAFSVICMAAFGAATLFAGAAFAQQFQDQTTTHFPQPSLTEYTSQLTVGDLDGDGDLDLVFANGGASASATQKLRVFINSDGLAHFNDETDARTGGLVFVARGVELGDADRDGDLDIIVAQDFNKRPALLINNGLGFFTDETIARLPNVTLSSSRGQFADVDNDGDLDLYFVNGGTTNRFGSGQGHLFINDGTGHFTDATSTNMPAGTVSQPMDCIFGDVDGDLDMDLNIGSRGGQSKIFKNNGAGVFTNSGFPADGSCYSYDFGDIDGDGDLDLLGANASPSVPNAEFLVKNNGSGTFTAAAFPALGIDDNDSKFFDYDNDGDLDLIVASLGSSERIYNNNGSGVFTQVNGLITAVADSSLDVKVADLSGDGRLDIVTAQGESGSFINRIYMNVTGPVDTIIPKFAQLEQVPNASGGNAGPFVVRTEIYDSHTSDRGFEDKGITLYFRVNGGSYTPSAMLWSGNSLWRGVIPVQKASGTIDYYVTAVDFNNNIGTSLTKSFTVTLPCPADVVASGNVNVDDLLGVINAWGTADPQFDIAPPGGNGVVDVDDLLAIINSWGPCP